MEYPDEVHILLGRIIEMKNSNNKEMRQTAVKILSEWDKARQKKT